MIPRNYSRYGNSLEIFIDELIASPKPEVILITSAMTYWYPGVFEAIKTAKRIFPKIPIILGGIYATLCYDHATARSGADFVVAGRGEIAVLKLVSSITGKEISFSPDMNNLDSFPYPGFDLYHKLPYVCVLTSLGCPYHCVYCASNLLNAGYFSRDPNAVADEICFWWEHYGVNNFAFYDDAFLFEPEKRLGPLLKEIIRRNIKCNFHTPNGIHIRGMTEEIAQLLFNSGFTTIRFGLETSNENLMKKTGEKATTMEFIHAVNFLKKAGFFEKEIGIYLLAGLPGQRADEVEESIRFVKDCGAHPFLSEYSPIPGTMLWEKAVNASRFDLVSEPLFHNNSIFPCEWEGFTRKDLEKLKKLAQ